MIAMKIQMAVLMMLIIVDGLIKRIWIKEQIGECWKTQMMRRMEKRHLDLKTRRIRHRSLRATWTLKVKQHRCRRSSHLTLAVCQLMPVHIVAFTTPKAWFNANRKIAINGFVMEKEQMNLAATFFGTWSNPITKRFKFILNQSSKTHLWSVTYVVAKTCSFWVSFQPRQNTASSCCAESHVWAKFLNRTTTLTPRTGCLSSRTSQFSLGLCRNHQPWTSNEAGRSLLRSFRGLKIYGNKILMPSMKTFTTSSKKSCSNQFCFGTKIPNNTKKYLSHSSSSKLIMTSSSKSLRPKITSKWDGITTSIKRKWHFLYFQTKIMSDWYQETSSSWNMNKMAKLNGKAEVISSK